MRLELALKQAVIEAGFDLAGIAPVGIREDLDFSRRWVEQGFGGEMWYLEDPKRADPRALLPEAKSVICVGLVYNAPLPYSTEAERRESETWSPEKEPARGARRNPDSELRRSSPEPRAWISRYAWGRDYHEVMRSKLEALRAQIERIAPGTETRVYVDTGPIVERAFARYSGIGWMGKNTCLINERKGSWFFLGVLLTTLALEPDLPAPDRCGSCTRCIEACPTGALDPPYIMNASRCIAYFTIELKGAIPAEFRAAIGNNVFGCDICQDVCPWNRGSQNVETASSPRENSLGRQRPAFSHRLKSRGAGKAGAAITSLPEFRPLEISLINGPQPEPETRHLKTEAFSLFNPRLEDLAAMSEDDFRRVFARSPVKRAKYRGWLRNLCVAMGNSGDQRFVPRLRELAACPDPILREHAHWALERLQLSAEQG